MHLTDNEAAPRAAVHAHVALGVALSAVLRQRPFPFPEGSRVQAREEACAALAWAVDHDRKCYTALYSLACLQVHPLLFL